MNESPAFYDPARFAFTEALERHWREILAEYHRIRGQLEDWVERELYNAGWQVFGVYNFPDGEPLADNVARCPLTARLIAEHFPRHGAGGFSVLAPGTEIHPHQGYQGDFLRCHLGLEVPAGDCGLSVAGEARRWEAGRVLVFDDRHWHQAWNRTPAERVILLVDFVP